MSDSATFSAFPNASRDSVLVTGAEPTSAKAMCAKAMSPAQRRDLKIINRIVMMVRAHRRLGSYESAIQISIENAVVLLHGELPTQELKNQLNSTIRQAGVLLRIDNAIEVLDA